MTCKDCFHYQVCDSFGFVLDPLHGGVTCCDFKTKADVVEVVRCKDCEHRYVPRHCALWYATANGTEYFIERGDDFSCSYGKKKEGAEE